MMQKDLKIQYIPVDSVRPNPYQPRKVFSQSALEDLASSIAEHGLMQPITVRMIGSSYELIAGERRLKASRLAGIREIPAVVVEVTTKDSAVLALIENLQRENLNFLEESEAYNLIMQDYGYTQQELAKTLGKNQSTVANKLRILKLSPVVKKKLIEFNLTERHARALLKLPSEELQLEVLEKVGTQELNVKKTEQIIEQILVSLTTEQKDVKKPNLKFKAFVRDIRLFTNTITQAVDMIQQSGIDAKYTMKQEDDGYEIRIKIPMNK
ncbi:MAG: nucleoid occlusion protein [Cellulosilyticaceae bacterium]